MGIASATHVSSDCSIAWLLLTLLLLSHSKSHPLSLIRFIVSLKNICLRFIGDNPLMPQQLTVLMLMVDHVLLWVNPRQLIYQGSLDRRHGLFRGHLARLLIDVEALIEDVNSVLTWSFPARYWSSLCHSFLFYFWRAIKMVLAGLFITLLVMARWGRAFWSLSLRLLL